MCKMFHTLPVESSVTLVYNVTRAPANHLF